MQCMIYIYLKKNELKTKLLLQVHDELIFESPENEIAKAERKFNTYNVESHKN